MEFLTSFVKNGEIRLSLIILEQREERKQLILSVIFDLFSSCSNLFFIFPSCQAIPNKYDHSVDEQDLTVEDWKRK